MDAERVAIARACLDAAHDASLSFPEIVGRLAAAGFESYLVDYRAGTQRLYLPDGDSVSLDMPPSAGAVAARFDAETVAAMVRWAQSGDADYSYAAFGTRVKSGGCAGYLVSFTGRRALYFGRSGETHVEHFPQ